MTTRAMTDHPIFKLGKQPAVQDSRNLMAGAVLRTFNVPDEWDFDTSHPGIPTPMFANDTLGCCVIAGRAHQTLRFEDIEQGSVMMISDADVKREYLKESGGQDNGLVVLDSLKAWRAGWKVGKQTLKIQAFAQVNYKNAIEVKRAIYGDVGMGIGVALPMTAQAEIQAGKPWATTTGKGSAKGSWGGHYVYVCGYTKAGPVCVTWGRKQPMTWAWFAKYCDEAYALFDAKNSFVRSRFVDGPALRAFLDSITK